MSDMSDMPDTTEKDTPDIKDEKRAVAEKTAPEKPQAPEAGGAGKGGAKRELEPLDFTSFILSLSTSVLMHLGVVENPVTKKTEKELPVARQTIDLIELLQEKTAGNLSEEETQLMVNVLRELRMLYVKAVG